MDTGENIPVKEAEMIEPNVATTDDNAAITKPIAADETEDDFVMDDLSAAAEEVSVTVAPNDTPNAAPIGNAVVNEGVEPVLSGAATTNLEEIATSPPPYYSASIDERKVTEMQQFVNMPEVVKADADSEEEKTDSLHKRDKRRKKKKAKMPTPSTSELDSSSSSSSSSSSEDEMKKKKRCKRRKDVAAVQIPAAQLRDAVAAALKTRK
jgi:hypothetical protein